MDTWLRPLIYLWHGSSCFLKCCTTYLVHVAGLSWYQSLQVVLDPPNVAWWLWVGFLIVSVLYSCDLLLPQMPPPVMHTLFHFSCPETRCGLSLSRYRGEVVTLLVYYRGTGGCSPSYPPWVHSLLPLSLPDSGSVSSVLLHVEL